MKTRLIISIMLISLLTGCEFFRNLTTVDINTDLKTDIPVVVPGVKSTAAVSFSKSQDLSLSSNADVEPYLDKIKEIDLKSLVVTITGLTTGQTINTLSLDVAGVGNVFTQTNITMTSNSFTPNVSATVLQQAGEKLKSDKKITLTVSGTASGPMSFTAKLTFDATIKASPIK